ncbi:NAD-dependent succinate-semialdehyde dehydrogenase [Candidatus Parcubacteria bacterium]|nr:MAG: NAD-dependent succinate-semialdehyde dehydrogenase [Candidatus Parcubacteria bacterium]
MLRSINPVTLQIVSETPELSHEDIDHKIGQAHAAFQDWRHTTFADRALLMKKAAAVLRSEKDRYAKIMSLEVGKTFAAAQGEVEKCALVCDYYADNAEHFLKLETIPTDAHASYVRFDPLGVILAVMPWNFPFWQVFRFAAPAIMAGNVGLLKHASNVQGSAQAIEDVFRTAGFPDGVFLNLAIGASKVAPVIADPRVKAITLTGSEKAGNQVAEAAGREIKKTVLELGGSDPFIVLPDADIVKAAKTAVAARMQANVGQSCIAAKRFIVHESIAAQFAMLLKEQVELLHVGDPLDPSTDVGPMVNEQVLRDVEVQVQSSIAKGAKVLTGGKRLERQGYFYPPTVLTQVQKGMAVFDEEVFGPVLPVISFTDTDAAIAMANDSPYGLGATIFSGNIEVAQQLASNIESGCVFINSQVKSDPRLPFGGVKKSGYGRELSHYGIKEFVNIKTISVSK